MIVNVKVVFPRTCISNLSLSLKLLAYWYHSLDVFICFSRGHYGNSLARITLRRTHVVEESWLYVDCCADALFSAAMPGTRAKVHSEVSKLSGFWQSLCVFLWSQLRPAFSNDAVGQARLTNKLFGMAV